MNSVMETTASARNIASSIIALPPLPATAQKILACFGDDFIDAELVSSIVECDAAICAKLLGLANSAYYGLAEPVHKIRDVISRVLGVDTVRSLVLAMAIQQSFDSKKCPAFDVHRFWKQSIWTAECCKKIAAVDSLISDGGRELAYTAGLCHNLGLMALAYIESIRTNSVLRAHSSTEAEPGKLSELLMAELDTDHRSVTVELAKAWSLPGLMIAAYQQRLVAETNNDERLGLIVASAAAAVGNLEVEDEHKTELSAWADEIGLAAEDLQRMAVFGERQREQVLTLASSMSV